MEVTFILTSQAENGFISFLWYVTTTIYLSFSKLKPSKIHITSIKIPYEPAALFLFLLFKLKYFRPFHIFVDCWCRGSILQHLCPIFEIVFFFCDEGSLLNLCILLMSSSAMLYVYSYLLSLWCAFFYLCKLFDESFLFHLSVIVYSPSRVTNITEQPLCFQSHLTLSADISL